MVKIRLRRTGAKKQPHYRVVVTDSKSPRDGKFIEVIGHYNPRTVPPTVEIDGERALYWLGSGAQPSAAVKRMFDQLGIMAQAAAVRRGEISVEQLAAQFRAQAQEPAEKAPPPTFEEQEELLPGGEEAEFEEEAELYDEDEEEEWEEEEDFDDDEYDLDEEEDLDDED
jgi:small subunit ribosomal protein S16